MADSRIGLLGIGLDTYWPQFTGLLPKLQGYQAHIHARLENLGVQLTDVGMVDSPEKALIAAETLRAADVDLILLYVSTYALSSTVLPIAQRTNKPIIVLNLQPTACLDYESFNALGDRGLMTGEWLGYCQSCSAPEIASVFNRAGIDYHLVTGTLDDPEAWGEIERWIAAAGLARATRNNRVGILGHYYNGMLDIYSDMTQQAAALGCHFEILEMDELAALREAVTLPQVRAKLAQFQRDFEVLPECSTYELERAARTSCALDALVEQHRLGSMAYYYEGTPGSVHEDIVTSVIAGNTLLTANHVPVAGECDIKNVQAMKILDLLGVGGSFSEFYLMDLEDDIVMLGHDGPGHPVIAEGRVRLVPLPLYHGKPGKGLSIQMRVQNGPVTLLALTQNRQGQMSLLTAEGDSVAGPILEIGNTNSRYRFTSGAKAFINAWCEQGPAHHCAIGVGHHADTLKKLAALLGLPYIRIC